MPSPSTEAISGGSKLIEYIIVGEQSDEGQQALSLQFPTKFLRITDHP